MPQLSPIFWVLFPFLMFLLLLIIVSYMEYFYSKIIIKDKIVFESNYKWLW